MHDSKEESPKGAAAQLKGGWTLSLIYFTAAVLVQHVPVSPQ